MQKFLKSLFYPVRDPKPTSIEALQRKTLAILLWSMGLGVFILRITLFILDHARAEPLVFEGKQEFYTIILVSLAGIIAIALIERYLSYLAASILFNLMIFIILLISDTPMQYLTGSSLVYFVFPVVTFSLLIRPWAGYIVAGAVSLAATILMIILHLGVPNLPAILFLFIVALIIQYNTSNLHHTLEQEQKNNRALRESEDRFIKIIETSPDPMLMMNLRGIITSCNQALLKTYGASSKTELIGKYSLDFIHPDERFRVKELRSQLLQIGWIRSMDLKCLRKDGVAILMTISAVVVTDWEGTPVSVMCILQDITERRQAEEKLHLNEEKYRRLIDQLPVGVMIQHQGSVLFINPAGAKLFGVGDPQDLIGSDGFERIHPDHRQQLNNRSQIALANGNVVEPVEIKLVKVDGHSFDAEASGMPFRYDDKPALLAVFTDITERKKASDQLREREEQNSRLIDLLPAGVIIHDHGRIIQVNPATVKMFAAENEAVLIGTQLFDRIHPDFRSIVGKRIEAALTRGQTAGLIEEKLLRMDGSVFFAEVAGLPMKYDEKDSILVVLNDITDRRQAQKAIELQNQRIQEVSQELVEVQEKEKHMLAAELHDDLGQALTSLKLMLELSASARSAGERRERLAEARNLTVELMTKVRNISLDLRPAMLDDFGLFAALRWLFDRLHSQTGINIRCNCDLDSKQRFDPQVETAGFRIIQEALTNIFRHASVGEARVSISTGSALTLEIADDGAGFDLDQVDQMSLPSAGLAGMQERARLLGGHVEIYSGPGTGTRVVAVIPLVQVPS